MGYVCKLSVGECFNFEEFDKNEVEEWRSTGVRNDDEKL